jgi:hypothetical protein
MEKRRENIFAYDRLQAASRHQAIARLLFFLLFSSSFAIDAFILRDRTNAFCSLRRCIFIYRVTDSVQTIIEQ